MRAEPSRTLFHPFEAGLLPRPGRDERVLFLGPTRDFEVPRDFGRLALVQGFRPYYLALKRQGWSVAPRVEGEGYDLALVLCGRYRGQNESRIAAALRGTVEGAPI